ncbi:MAG: pgk [Francisellaceae bacterium]|nr:pgk [Francisellaceae bacterium]
MKFKQLSDIEVANKKVVVRLDLNVPILDGHISSDARIKAAIPTIKYLLDKNAAIILLSHLGRPIEGQWDAQYSLQSVAERLANILNHPVRFEKNWLNGLDVNHKEIILCENVRFNVGEEANDKVLAQQMANLGDVFVMDAFGSAHRAHASTEGIAHYALEKAAGLLLSAELEALSKAIEKPKPPVIAIVGGSKVSSKLFVLEALCQKVDKLMVGGGIANTFLKAAGFEIGSSLFEPNLIKTASDLLIKAKEEGCEIVLPQDVVVANTLDENAEACIKSLNEIDVLDKIFDIGPKSILQNEHLLKSAGTIIWNGPVGVFEIEKFAKGTQELAKTIANSSAFSLAGGGDTLAAIEKYQIWNNISYISTGGGAFLEYLEGKVLPGVAALQL